MPSERPNRRLTTILAADAAGYSRLVGADEEGTLERLRAIRKDLIDFVGQQENRAGPDYDIPAQQLVFMMIDSCPSYQNEEQPKAVSSDCS